MNAVKFQQGMSIVGWLLTLAVVAFVASTAFKLVPHYMDNRTLSQAIESIGADKSARVDTVGEFYGHVSRAMQVNNIQDLDLNKVLSVTDAGNVFQAHLKYEKREPLIQNLDVVVKFDRQFSVVKP
ncbi:DUF4845 domain-containing protein [Pseudomonas sp. RIT-PI-a]|uniref:DUF4845 domain-containing protein n=1 Tax=Pseudomonas sp. RIT-PI-a TaxID=1681194 RepID=UPI0006766C7D|nr:DUF4845 domain-containing protein [Pseudomonas sp. RIT-PI-a]KNC14574.1 hypothetical protein AC788_11250 [Pseudomonas sp. RIT-PI-a]